MKKSQAIEFTEEVSTLLDVGRRLLGDDKETVIETISQTLQTARVNHRTELGKAKIRRGHFRKNPDATLRRVTPTWSSSLLQALAELVELNEEQELRNPHANPTTTLWPQAYRDRYSLELLVQSFQNPLTAIVAAMMVQHDYLQREAHEAFEIVTQHSATQKTDPKFYDKRTEINSLAKKRFDKSNFFQLAPSGKDIQTVAISETEAEANYAFLELCAHLLGKPFFSTPFNPLEPIPELVSNVRNFDEENTVEDRRIQAVVSPTSLQNLIESLEYMNMKTKAKGPVLKNVISGNGNGGIHGTPLLEESDAEKQAAINRVVNDYVASVGLRRALRNPKLEVVVDGIPIAEPFATTSHTVCHFKLSALAKYVQVFATQCGRRVIVSNLSLPQTQISRGRAWHSELELEGHQKLSLRIEPRMDESGNLTEANLIVGYKPKVALSEKLAELSERWSTLVGQLWPAWATTGTVACAIGVLALAPFLTIDVFSFRALVTLVLSVTGFLFVVGKFKPAWQRIWPQQVAVNSFVSVMLIGMLLLGILPTGGPPGNAVSTSSIEASAPDEGSSGAGANLIGSQVKPLFFYSGHGFKWQVTGSTALWLDVDLTRTDNVFTKYLIVGNAPVDLDPWPDSNTFYVDNRAFRTLWQPRFDSIWPKGDEVAPVASAREQVSVSNKPKHSRRRTKAVSSNTAEVIALHETFYVDVLVDTTQVITLMQNAAPVSLMSEPVVNGQAGTIRVATSDSNATKTEPETRTIAETQASVVETAKLPGPSPGAAVTARETPALVVFESPTRLGSLSKGDVLNANFKSIALSTRDARGETLVCTATGVVEDITRTSGTDVQVRVGLVLTWQSGGNTVNRELQLLLTACSKNIENSHYGVLAAPATAGAAVARNDVRLSTLPKQR